MYLNGDRQNGGIHSEIFRWQLSSMDRRSDTDVPAFFITMNRFRDIPGIGVESYGIEIFSDQIQFAWQQTASSVRADAAMAPHGAASVVWSSSIDDELDRGAKC